MSHLIACQPAGVFFVISQAEGKMAFQNSLNFIYRASARFSHVLVPPSPI